MTHDPEYVAHVRDAEAAAQRSVCHVPTGDLPDELAEALERRVEVNLAQADGRTLTRVGSTDPKVRALEAPFSRRRSVVTDEPSKPRGRQRRATKSKTRKGES